MNIVVTGVNGLVGSRLARLLAARGHRVGGLARGARRIDHAVALDYRCVDLVHAEAVQAAIVALRPEVIINAAGMTEVDRCEHQPEAAYEANVAVVATLCRAARAIGARVVHLSTDYVFDGNDGPYDVDALPNPQGVYATTKLMGELAVRVLCDPQRWTIARTAVVYGWPPAAKPNFGSWLVEALSAGRTVKLFEDQWVSPSLAANVAAMLAELVERALAGTWHVAGAQIVDRVTFGRRLAARFGLDAELIQASRMQDVKLASPRPARSGLVVARTAAELAEQPLPLDRALDLFHAEHVEAR